MQKKNKYSNNVNNNDNVVSVSLTAAHAAAATLTFAPTLATCCGIVYVICQIVIQVLLLPTRITTALGYKCMCADSPPVHPVSPLQPLLQPGIVLSQSQRVS